MTASGEVKENLGENEAEPKGEQVTGPASDENSDISPWLRPDTPDKIRDRVGKLQHTVAFMAYSGPLPPPSDLAEYDGILPGAADRILRMAEESQNIQRRALNGKISIDKTRAIFSGVTSICLIASAVIAILYDPAWLSIPLGSVGLITLFVRDWYKSRKDR